MKLVIVDDIAVNRKLLRVTLEAEGHTTLEAADGVEALEILNREKVDAVLSDVLMPRMDGYRLCHEIRTDDRLCDLPIVIYTSTYTTLSDEKLAVSMGADRYLKKPAPAHSILAAVHEAIAEQHTAPRPAPWQEVEVLKEYSDRLVTKLEERNIELERQLRLAALSVEVSSALMNGTTLRDILARCAEALVRHLDASLARIWTLDPKDGAPSLEASAAVSGYEQGRHGGAPVGPAHTGLAPFPGQERAGREGFEAFAGFPLTVGARTAGVMELFAPEAFSQAALDNLASIADTLALGMERKRLDQELRGALAEKVALLQEVHHRVNNNLQIICSLLSMQIAACPDGNAFSTPLKDARSRVMAMSLVHDQIYRSESLADLNLGNYVESLSGQLYRSYCGDRQRIGLELSLAPIRLDLDQAIPCGLILNELLSNALKHAFADGRAGVIRISLKQTEAGELELAVADDGIGLPEGLKLQRSVSPGMQVVQILAKQLQADLSVAHEGGTAFTLRMKLSGDAAVSGIFKQGHKAEIHV